MRSAEAARSAPPSRAQSSSLTRPVRTSSACTPGAPELSAPTTRPSMNCSTPPGLPDTRSAPVILSAAARASHRFSRAWPSRSRDSRISGTLTVPPPSLAPPPCHLALYLKPHQILKKSYPSDRKSPSQIHLYQPDGQCFRNRRELG